MPIIIRPAVADDQPAIVRIVWAARINPLDLDWQRFLVAEEDGQIVGVGQVKPHRDGSRELASLAVIPGCRGRGVGGALVRALLNRERGSLHLMCRDQLDPYYARFGFRRLEMQEMPPSFQRIARLARGIAFVISLAGGRVGFVVMRRDA